MLGEEGVVCWIFKGSWYGAVYTLLKKKKDSLTRGLWKCLIGVMGGCTMEDDV